MDYVDMITEPGIASVLSNHERPVRDITTRIEHSLKYGCEPKLFIVGHDNCDFCIAEKAEKKNQIKFAIARIKKEFPELEVYGLWFVSDTSVEVFDGANNENNGQ
jgi:hypothetical protein